MPISSLPSVNTQNNTLANHKIVNKNPYTQTNTTVSTQNIPTVDTLAKNSNLRNTPPMTNQVFNTTIPSANKNDSIPLNTTPSSQNTIINPPSTSPLSDTMKKPPKGKFSIDEAQNLENLYGKESIKQSTDEQGYIDKKKFSSFLSSSSFPPMKLNSSEDIKNLFNIDV
jgi:hypothetical protein